MTVRSRLEAIGGEKIVRTTCCSHCGGACPLRIHVKDGIITRIETDDGEEPQYRACLRGRAYRQRVYAPDRLQYPLKRIGDRGEGKFKRISWDEALDTTAKELMRVKETYGPASIIFLGSGGDTMRLHGPTLYANLLARSGGFTATWGWKSAGQATFAAYTIYGNGCSVSNSKNDLLNSRLIIMWGWNPTSTIFDTNTNLFMAEARKAGIKIISVDPRHTNATAAFAKQWIPIRPGTDTAMLVAMAYVMIHENLQDQKFLDTYTKGFEQFKDYVTGKEDNIPKTPGWAESITGVQATVITRLAREYATTKPAALLAGIGPGRSASGEQYHRAAITLAVMTGNVGIHGGSTGHIPRIGPMTSKRATMLGPPVGGRLKRRKNPVDMAPNRRHSFDWEDANPGWRSSARIVCGEIADAILKGKSGGYPADYKLLFMTSTNYINQYPNSNKIAEAMKTLEFIAITEQFMTASAKYADIVLPASTYMERNDLALGGVTLFYGYVNKVIDALHESKSHFEIASELAVRLGISDFSDKTEEEWLKEVIDGCKDIPDYDTFKKNAIHRVKPAEPTIAFKEQITDPVNHPFPTSSGKIEIFSQDLADLGDPMLPPIPKYIETWESYNDPLAKKYPLQLITTHFGRRAHSQFDNIPWLRELEPQAMLINTADAHSRGIEDGNEVRVFNDRGEVIIPAKVTERIMPGVVDIPQGAWYNPDKRNADRGGCANTLTKDAASPGGNYTTNTCLVQVEKS